jgi:pyruvate formate lyase activating enzyme
MSLSHLGLVKTTLIDYPGLVAATVFTAGCNLRCPYCHNPNLVSGPTPGDFISLSEFEGFLKKRSRVIGGVCITGGEPLLHPEISSLMSLIQGFGLKVKIDTNGTFPDRLRDISPDFIAMDIKTAPERYNELYPENKMADPASIIESIEYILSSGIAHEFRTTVVPGIVTEKEIRRIFILIKGTDSYVLSQFRATNTLNPDFESVSPYPIETLFGFQKIAEEYEIPCRVRTH